MSELNPTTPNDADADSAVAAQKDAYDLFDRTTLYAKAEQSYNNKELSREWKRPPISSAEVGVDEIRDFDSNDDNDNELLGKPRRYSGDMNKGHPRPDRSCLPKDLDLSSMLVKERRAKRFLMLLCFILGLACLTLLLDPNNRHDGGSINDPGLRSFRSKSQYVIPDDEYTDQEEGNDLPDNSLVSYSNQVLEHRDITPTDFFKSSDAEAYVGEIDNGEYPVEEGSVQDFTQGHQSNLETTSIYETNDIVDVAPNTSSYADQSGNQESVSSSQVNNGVSDSAPNNNLNSYPDQESASSNQDSASGNQAEENTDSWSPLAIQSNFRSLTNVQPVNDDLPFLWFIPKAGSNRVQDVLMRCFNLVASTREGGLGEHANAPLETFIGATDARQYVNVDLTTVEGIKSAIDRNFIQSKLADVAITPMITEASEIFSNGVQQQTEKQQQQLGRCLALLRHPIERAVDIFNTLKATNSLYRDTSIEGYAESMESENNWMTRELTGKTSGGVLNDRDLLAAKEFLRDYCVIGIHDQIAESIRRFGNAFGWKSHDVNAADGFSPCVDNTLRQGSLIAEHNVSYGEESWVWSLFLESNRYDMELYRYALELFRSGT